VDAGTALKAVAIDLAALGDTARLWSDWLADGRVRKFAVVAQKT